MRRAEVPLDMRHGPEKGSRLPDTS